MLEHNARQEHETLQLIEQFSRFQQQLGQNIEQMSFEQKRTVLRLLVTDVLLDCSKATITVKHVLPVENRVSRLSSNRVITSAINARP